MKKYLPIIVFTLQVVYVTILGVACFVKIPITALFLISSFVASTMFLIIWRFSSLFQKTQKNDKKGKI